MIYTKFDHISFLLRTIAVCFVLWICYGWVQDAAGANGYEITGIGDNTVTVNVGIMRATVQVESTDGIEVGMRVPNYPELQTIAVTTYYVITAFIVILILWHIGIYAKIGKRIKRAKFIKTGFKQPGNITAYRHIVGTTYAPVVDEKFHPEYVMTKGDIKKYPIGTPCIIYHLGPKDSWIDIVRERDNK